MLLGAPINTIVFSNSLTQNLMKLQLETNDTQSARRAARKSTYRDLKGHMQHAQGGWLTQPPFARPTIVSPGHSADACSNASKKKTCHRNDTSNCTEVASAGRDKAKGHATWTIVNFENTVHTSKQQPPSTTPEGRRHVHHSAAHPTNQ